MLDHGMTSTQIAERLGRPRPSIQRVIRELRADDLNTGADATSDFEATVRAAGGDYDLAATGGRYAALAAYADRRGITCRAALSRWHRLGVPVRKAAS